MSLSFSKKKKKKYRSNLYRTEFQGTEMVILQNLFSILKKLTFVSKSHEHIILLGDF